ncbi:thiol peroxidase [Corynebacterium sp. 153RC1]|uniref:thiol peroxidase n=1 Tax=Corynebacterium TaxID=1716 RepID=UPI00211C330B|nr:MULTISPECIES: thiol peroxidase [unclassified Corynebacterium]MCQ9342518.1 thiol peroxidase [Corynebacterium sp. 76QC2CO]MCQ9351493.1 thiol peroxidase [Corynebacterium sp. 209RC1]MCQ9354622.1 thiol peroxidase [Corynebacterium sp. 1222RC1]MCQ9357526.1 thiol peroxidase [Corynebacterium sp. 122RC1]MCQ9360376.1 thiol peroxidase [Corynebacterium sp. 153RC1]
MANTHFKGEEVSTSGELPKVGDVLPAFDLVGQDLGTVAQVDFAGSRLVLNIFPSIDTGVCAASVREFNKLAASLENTKVLGVSKDLPFALGRFCAAEGIENVVTASAFRSSFGQDYGLDLEGSPLKGLLARAVIVADADGTITHVELVEEITQEPDYDAAIEALR